MCLIRVSNGGLIWQRIRMILMKLGGKMSPSAVLVIQNGATKLVNIKNQDTVTKILDMVPDVVDRITGKFGDVKMDDDIDEAISDVTDEE